LDSNVIDSVMQKYQDAAGQWGSVMVSYASWLFWGLVLLSMVWTYGMMAMRRAEIQEVLAETIRFLALTGFFWWILINGPAIGNAIVKSMFMIGAKATGQGADFTPGGIVQVGYDIFAKAIDQSSVWSPTDSVIGMVISLVILIVLTIVGVNLLLVFVSAWTMIFGGVFLLGFGGGRWTSEIAINYYKTVLAIGAELMVMVLLMGIGKTFINDYYTSMGAGTDLKEMAVMLIAAFVLMYLTNKLPPRVAGAIGVGGSGIGGVGVGSLMAAGAVAAAGAATAGAAIGAGLASGGGGASALKAAFQSAQQNMAQGGTSGGSGDLSGGLAGPGAQPPGAISDGARAFMSAMGTSGRFAVDMGGALAKGASQVAGDKVGGMISSAKERIADTTGGKIATAIRSDMSGSGSDSATAGVQQAASVPVPDSFGGDSLGKAGQGGIAGTSINEEVAAFVAKGTAKTA
jgi:type IV secretion system protein VirB6/type IV secretion system protein TrbL